MDKSTGLNIDLLSGGYVNRKVIEDISCHIPKGQITLLVGRNGSGKSTLLRAIMGLLPESSGSVFWEGTRLACPPHKMRQQGIIYVPQRKAFFSTLSIVTNLELACTQKARNDRRRLIKLALQRFSSLNDNARRTAVSLSGGERKLLAFACGVIVPPSLLLADEPLAGLSPRARSTMLGHLKHATQESGVTILLVEHDVLKATRIADRVIGFREGRLVVDCPSSEFDDSLQRRVFLD